jgi:predicted XRE-type DNA-binding protein
MEQGEDNPEILLRPLVWMGDSLGTAMNTEPKSIDGSGNIFVDLELDDADELFTRGKIGVQVIRLLNRRNLKQREIGELLGISQPEVSLLMNGEFQRFSDGKLINFLKRLDAKVTRHIQDRNLTNESSETLVLL